MKIRRTGGNGAGRHLYTRGVFNVKGSIWLIKRTGTGGGLHGKDLSKADVSVNIYCWIKAQITGEPVQMCCAIGDAEVDGVPYSEIVEIARDFIKERGGFEKFAEWGLIE